MEGFGEVRGGDLLGVGEVGDGARELEHAMVAARRELQPRHRRLEEPLRLLGYAAMRAHLLRSQFGVANEGRPD